MIHDLRTAAGRRAEQSERAGCVALRKCNASGTVVGIYRSVEAGIEDDPTTPWSLICEDHGAVICIETIDLARQHAAWPGWCADCCPALERYWKKRGWKVAPVEKK